LEEVVNVYKVDILATINKEPKFRRRTVQASTPRAAIGKVLGVTRRSPLEIRVVRLARNMTLASYRRDVLNGNKTSQKKDF
jgi:hypothetical protein